MYFSNVDEDAVRNIMGKLFDFAGPKANGGAETMLCFTATEPTRLQPGICILIYLQGPKKSQPWDLR